jgi:hypothetical protein
LRRNSLVKLDLPAMRTPIPIPEIRRCTGHRGPVARARPKLPTRG